MSKSGEKFELQMNSPVLLKQITNDAYNLGDEYLRELIANAADAIFRRTLLEPGLEGEIQISVFPEFNTMSIRDNGEGMSREMLRNDFSVVGTSGTGTGRKSMSRDKEINQRGQFGTGRLAAFSVASKIIYRTRKLGQEKAWTWINTGSVECEIIEDSMSEPGTEIIIIFKDEFAHHLKTNFLKDTIKKYCNYLPYKIYLNDEGPLNIVDPPWFQDHWVSEEQKIKSYSQFVIANCSKNVIGVIPIDIEGPTAAKGVLYFTSDAIADISSTGRIDLYLRRILIKKSFEGILPFWAVFVGGVLDCNDLKPTTSRNDVQTNDPNLELLSNKIGEIIVDAITKMAQENPAQFSFFNETNHFHLKRLAVAFDEVRAKLKNNILLETNMGRMSLETYLQTNPTRNISGKTPLYFFSQRRGRDIYYNMAEKANLVVIDAEQPFETELLVKLVEDNPDTLTLAPVDNGINSVLFTTPHPDDSQLVNGIESSLMQALSMGGFYMVDLQVKHFEPEDCPSLVLATDQSVAQASLKSMASQKWILSSFGSLTEEVENIIESEPAVRIIVNLNHTGVRRLGMPEFKNLETGDILAALIFDNPVGGSELIGEKLKTYASRCKERLLHKAMDELLDSRKEIQGEGY